MTDQQTKFLALTKIIGEEFTEEQIRATLADLILFVHKDDEVKAIQYLEKLSNRYKEIG